MTASNLLKTRTFVFAVVSVFALPFFLYIALTETDPPMSYAVAAAVLAGYAGLAFLEYKLYQYY